MVVPPESSSLPDPRALNDALSQRIKRLHRRILDPDVLRGLLPARARVVARASEQADAKDREMDFRNASPAYARAIEDIDQLLESTRQVTIDSLKWWVPLAAPDDPALVERALGQQGFPYRVITQTREVALGGTMIDIGANTGRMSIPRVILGDAMAAYCAEPDPLNYACLVRNVRDNHLAGLVLPDHVAIDDANGMVLLQRSKSAGGHRIVESSRKAKRGLVEVPSLTLDTWVDRVGIDLHSVRFVKVDVQGSEVAVLRGAARVLACKHIAWQIEVDPGRLAGRGTCGAELCALMQQHFTHFVDLNRHVTTTRARPVGELTDALTYVTNRSAERTDVVLFTLETPARD